MSKVVKKCKSCGNTYTRQDVEDLLYHGKNFGPSAVQRGYAHRSSLGIWFNCTSCNSTLLVADHLSLIPSRQRSRHLRVVVT